jgi:hypothetical protein
MKTIFLTLMVLASVAYAQTKMSDAEMKKLIVGPWKFDCDCSTKHGENTIEYKSDGTVIFKLDGKDVVEKWWVEDGALLETDASIERTCYYKILFLTENEFLTLGMTPHAKGYFFLRRTDWDIDNYIPTKR